MKTRTVANGQGTIYRRAGRKGWFAAITVNGRRKIFHADTKGEVDRMLSAAKVAKDAGELVTAPSQTVENYLRAWLDIVKRDRKPGTYTSYEHLRRLHAYPHIGKVRLDKLTAAQVQRMLDAERDAGLSPRTVQYLRAVVRKALDRAWRLGLVSRNVAAVTEAPRVTRARIKPFDRVEFETFRRAITGDRLEALYAVAVSLGLRQGEALGLRWQDVQLEGVPFIQLSSQLQRVDGHLALVDPKSRAGHRTIALPAPIADQLRRHRGRPAD